MILAHCSTQAEKRSADCPDFVTHSYNIDCQRILAIADRLCGFWFGAAARKTVLRSWKISVRDVEYIILIVSEF